MRSLLFPVAFLALAPACSSPEEVSEQVGDPSASASASATATGSSAAAQRKTSIETDDFWFTYTVPATANAMPGLKALLQAREDSARSEIEASSSAERKAAAESDYEYRKHSLSVEWKLVADLPGWLSLSSEISTYTGGAHPNYGFGALVWDKAAARAMEPVALFRSPIALENAVAGRFCDALNRQREDRRGMDVDPESESYFDDCPAIEDLTVLVGSSNGRNFDRIGLLAAPYVAGPYAEGSYDITVLVDAAVIDAVKPEFADAFSFGESAD